MRLPIELLAPSGCFPSLQAAIDAGADAVYFGLAQLNMRARARRSFEAGDLPEIMERCRAAEIKGFLALNTVLYDHDLPLTTKLLGDAARNGVDAVIVSDMAAVQIANELGLETHLSTQLSISNFQSLKFYARLCDRVVLARELNLQMISRIHRQIQDEDLRGRSGRPMELEAFAHGALCIAISGRCGMSLFTANASANRGACAQNCRREYEVTDKETGDQLVVDNNYIMSPNDIATIDFLDQLVASGIRILKIEGRGRSPEYVKTVTRAYRKAIDALHEGQYDRELTQELLIDLKKVYNRGLSSGYYLGREQGWSGAYGSKATLRKVEVGCITNYLSQLGVAVIQSTSSEFSRADDYVIIGNSTGVIEGTANDLRVDGNRVESIKPGELFSLKVDAKVRRNDRIFKMVPADV